MGLTRLRTCLCVLLAMTVAACAPAPKQPTPQCVSWHLEHRATNADLTAREDEYIRTHPSAISRSEAIERAVAFLRAEGFTDAPPTAPPDSLHRDIIEGGSAAETLAQRHDTIDPHAVGVRREAKYWLVAFPWTKRAREDHASRGIVIHPDHGRGVAVTIDGQNASMRHQDLCLPYYEPPFSP